MLGVSFQDLLRYEEAEARKWEAWFGRNPAALNVPVSEEKNVRRVVVHLFAVGQRNIQRLLGEEQTPNDQLPQNSLRDLFAVGEATRDKVRRFLAEVSPEELGRARQF